jgi:lipoprotein signal peptidase
LVTLTALVVLRVCSSLTRVGATVVLVGPSSNLLDRLGLAEITQGAHGRVVVNWFYLGIGRVRLGNVADLCYVVGTALLLVAATRAATRAPHGRAPRHSTAGVAIHHPSAHMLNRH